MTAQADLARPTLRTVTIHLPLPPQGCSPNESGHRHWRGPAAAIAEYRAEAFYAVKQLQEAPLRPPVRLCVTFHTGGKRNDGRYRPIDVQNGISSLKACCDGIVDAGLLPDDSAKYLRWGETVIVGDKGRAPEVVIVLTEEAT